MKLTALLLAALALTPSATAGEIVVPTDQPDLQAALAAAAPGDVIRVRTNADQAVAPSLVIDKPVTILGEPVCNIRIQHLGPHGIELQGPGSGEVTLARVDLRYASQDSSGARAIFGGGFDVVHLVDSDIVHDHAPFSGLITESYPAVELTGVTLLSVAGSHLRGGRAGADSYCVSPSSFHFTDGRAGIDAPNTAVLLTDSVVEGGVGGDGTEVAFLPCDTSLDGWGGRGGAGVRGDALRSYPRDFGPGGHRAPSLPHRPRYSPRRGPPAQRPPEDSLVLRCGQA